MMLVPLELQQQVWQYTEQLERFRSMPYDKSLERRAIESGMELGVLQGKPESWQLAWIANWIEGWHIGIPIGIKKGEASLLERQLTRRFGPLSAETRARLANAPLDQLGQWADNILDAQSLDAVFTSH